MVKLQLDTPVQYLKGVGPKVAKLLRKFGVITVEDLIFLFPRDYDDRSIVTPIAKLQPGSPAVILAEIISLDLQLTRSRFSVLKVVLADKSNRITAVWFNQPYLTQLFRPGMKLLVTGELEISTFDASRQLQVRDYEIYSPDLPKIVPVYSLTEGLFPKKLRSIIKSALKNLLSQVRDWLPAKIKKRHALAELHPSIMTLHFPNKLAEVEPARRRLAFDELFLFQLG
jgi:ATP-dependent DNA helicase RecG